MKETHARSIAKAVIWRVIATLTTMTAVFILTGELLLAGGVGLIEASAKIFLYYFHERGWNRVMWGKVKAR